MSASPAGFTVEQFEQFKGAISALGRRQGSFDHIEATLAIVRTHLVEKGQLSDLGNLRTIIGALRTMEDLGYIKRLTPANGDSRRWLWVGEAGAPEPPPAA